MGFSGFQGLGVVIAAPPPPLGDGCLVFLLLFRLRLLSSSVSSPSSPVRCAALSYLSILPSLPPVILSSALDPTFYNAVFSGLPPFAGCFSMSPQLASLRAFAASHLSFSSLASRFLFAPSSRTPAGFLAPAIVPDRPLASALLLCFLFPPLVS